MDPNGKNNSAWAVLKAQPLPSLDTHVALRVGTTAMVADQTRGTLIIASSAAAAPAGNSVMDFGFRSEHVFADRYEFSEWQFWDVQRL
jgi:hypothetical protein